MLQPFSSSNSFDLAHKQALEAHFRAGIGYKVFILTPSYPFLFIGRIVSLVEDYVEILVETTQFESLEKRTWLINIHNIEVFYIEFPGEPRIPELNDMT